MKNKEIRDELEKISPFLYNMKKERAFKVPDNYFDQLPDELVAKAKQVIKPAEKNRSAAPDWLIAFFNPLSSIFNPQMALGLATVALLVISGLFLFNQKTIPAEEEFLADLSIEEIRLYLNENIEVIDEELLIEISTNQESFELFDPLELGDEQLEDLIEELDDEFLEELL